MLTASNNRSSAFETSVVEGIARIARDQWNALVGAQDSPFVEWDWLHAMEESGSAGRKTGWAPCHLVVREGRSGKLIAACPLYLKSHSMGEFVFDQGWAQAAQDARIRYYPKLLAGVPFTPHQGRRILTAEGIDRERMLAIVGQALVSLCTDNRFSSVHVNFCEADEAGALRELGLLERLGYQYHWHNAGLRTFDDYLAQLKHKRRSAVRHERAALLEQGITVRAIPGEALTASDFSAIRRLYLSTVDKLYWGRRYLTSAFFDLVRQTFKRYIVFVGAWRGPKLIAGAFNVEKAGVLYGRYWGCFEELRFLHFNVCYYAGIEHCIEHALERFEPGAGGEYKWLRGFDPALTRSAHFIAHPALAQAVADYLRRERREVEAWIEEGRERSQLKAPRPSDAEAP